MKKIKRILAGFLVSVIALSCAAIVSATQVKFTDVADHWAWKNGQIPYLVEKEVLNGYKNDNGTYSFKPDGAVTRAEFIKMLDETFGLTATTEVAYSDIKEGDWYYPYFAKAAAQGYILNYGTKGSPNQKISRQEATSLLVRYLNLPANEKAASSAIADYSDISTYYKEYILRAVYAGIINGYTENGKTYFKPEKTLTRAEALTILYRAAGCIYNKNTSSRDNGAHTENNMITRVGISINNVEFDGRNIVTEGATSGTITFNKCEINGTLLIRGSANITFYDCEVENVIALGGGKITVTGGTEIESVVLEKASNIVINSNSAIDSLDVKNGCNNVKVTGNGSIKSLHLNADGFSASMMPEEFVIGNNLEATFNGESFSGTSDTQNSFTIAPFTTSDGAMSYINLSSEVGGRVYYYYTNASDAPSMSGFNLYYANADCYGYFDIAANTAHTQEIFTLSDVVNYSYLVIQLQSGGRKYPAVKIENNTSAVNSGFSTEPYLVDDTTVKYKASLPGTVMWFYVDSGTSLNQLDFITAYEKQSSALKGEVSVNALNSYNVTLKENYLKNYDYVAFMLRDATGIYHTPVILSVGDNGFEVLPSVKTPGIITFKPSVSGKIYYYLSSDATLPSAASFKAEYNAARYGDYEKITRSATSELKYETSYISNYPYMVISIQNSDGEFMTPVLLDINLTTGFDADPKVRDANTIYFKASDYGTVYYYYSKKDTIPALEDFMDNYDDTARSYKGLTDCTNSYNTIEYKSSYVSTYPYMVLMFVDDSGKRYCPVLVELDAVSDTGFVVAPYAENGKVYFSCEDDGEVLYFYSMDDSNVTPDDFYDWYRAQASDGRGTVPVSEDAVRSFDINESLLDKYPYIILAFLEEGDDTDEFHFPYVLDVAGSEVNRAGTGITVTNPDSSGNVSVRAKYDGKLYFYLTDRLAEVASSADTFKSYYADAVSSASGTRTLSANDTYSISMNGFKYLVICLKTKSGYYLTPVSVDSEYGVTGGSSYDDGANKSGYGFREFVFNNNNVYLRPNSDGNVTLLIVQNGSVIWSESHSVTKDEDFSAAFKSYGGSFADDILSLFMGNYEYYVQFNSGNDIYEAYKINVTIS